MASGHLPTLEIKCGGCSAAFRMRLKRGRIPKEPIPCPKCGDEIEVDEQNLVQPEQFRQRPSTGARETRVADVLRQTIVSGAEELRDRLRPSKELLSTVIPKARIFGRKKKKKKKAPEEQQRQSGAEKEKEKEKTPARVPGATYMKVRDRDGSKADRPFEGDEAEKRGVALARLSRKPAVTPVPARDPGGVDASEFTEDPHERETAENASIPADDVHERETSEVEAVPPDVHERETSEVEAVDPDIHDRETSQSKAATTEARAKLGDGAPEPGMPPARTDTEDPQTSSLESSSAPMAERDDSVEEGGFGPDTPLPSRFDEEDNSDEGATSAESGPADGDTQEAGETGDAGPPRLPRPDGGASGSSKPKPALKKPKLPKLSALGDAREADEQTDEQTDSREEEAKKTADKPKLPKLPKLPKVSGLSKPEPGDDAAESNVELTPDDGEDAGLGEASDNDAEAPDVTTDDTSGPDESEEPVASEEALEEPIEPASEEAAGIETAEEPREPALAELAAGSEDSEDLEEDSGAEEDIWLTNNEVLDYEEIDEVETFEDDFQLTKTQRTAVALLLVIIPLSAIGLVLWLILS